MYVTDPGSLYDNVGATGVITCVEDSSTAAVLLLLLYYDTNIMNTIILIIPS